MSGQQARPAPVSKGRVAAARAALAEDEGAHAEDALSAALVGLADGDVRHAWFLVFGMLRHRGQVDAALRPVLSAPIEGLDPAVRVVLRLGTFERLFGRAADHAVVSQWVEVSRRVGAGRASGLVNAVLRRASPPAQISEADALDHPAWLLARWKARYGENEARAWASANRDPAPVCVVARTGAAGLAESFAQALLTTQPASIAGETLSGVLRVNAASGAVDGWPGFHEGAFWVQDASAVAVADLVPRDAKRVLDACAAPGGKSFRLASRGHEVLATDREASRLARVTEGAARLSLKIETRCVDWLAPMSAPEGTFDAVLVDAPCTGLGTIRRHPEIRWRRLVTDLALAAERQHALLERLSVMVAPGGVLVYAVCSPEPEEGEYVVSAFLQTHPEFSLEHTLHTAPPEAGEDAHHAVRMRRAL